MTKSVSIMGATGSVGRSALAAIAHANAVSETGAAFAIDTLTANRDVDALAGLAIEFNAKLAVIADEACFDSLRNRLGGTGIEVACGPRALATAAARPVDRLVAAIVGIA
ncbi:MAG: 1-deoxy-D-xylulose-5-phosphate reductoisomerase, partial [Pseudomonadota bacterium]|nr:1-deoxy-D-xylulose-5-phosphate reductoisomerase [Pseudomonadota bacterium]